MNTLTSKYMSGRLLLISGMTGLIALTTLTVPAVQAQGLGGFLNKAKEKVNQATSASPDRVTQAATQAVEGNDGELPPQPRDLEDVDMQDWYTRTVLANTRPYDDGDGSRTNDSNYRHAVHRIPGFPKITYDRPALEWYASHNKLLMDIIDAWCDGFDSMLYKNRPQLIYIKPHFSKIKEIHFGVTPNLPAKSDDGWGKSWNPATGVFTVLVCSKPGYNQSLLSPRSPIENSSIEAWIIKNVN